MNKEALMKKVEKLLALAQKLIAEYNLDMSNLSSEDKEEIVMMAATHSNNEGYRIRLAQVLAANFRCRVIMCGNTVNFMGYKTDAEVCVKVYNYAYRLSHNKGLKIERQYRKEGLNTKGVANSYWIGFCDGVKTVLDEQCRALMIVVPGEVDEELHRRAKGQYKGGMRMRGYDVNSYNHGKEDGKNHMRSRQIEA